VPTGGAASEEPHTTPTWKSNPQQLGGGNLPLGKWRPCLLPPPVRPTRRGPGGCSARQAGGVRTPHPIACSPSPQVSPLLTPSTPTLTPPAAWLLLPSAHPQQSSQHDGNSRLVTLPLSPLAVLLGSGGRGQDRMPSYGDATTPPNRLPPRGGSPTCTPTRTHRFSHGGIPHRANVRDGGSGSTLKCSQQHITTPSCRRS
jgi:hypothetical protein